MNGKKQRFNGLNILLLLHIFSFLFNTNSLASQTNEWLNYTNGETVNGIAEDAFYVWAATTGGLARLNKFTNEIHYFTRANSGLPVNRVNSITIGHQNNKWLGTSYGLVKFDDENWTVYNLSNSDLPEDCITTVEIDDRGLLDALNAYDIGLGEWDYQVIKYGYSEYASASAEATGLANTLAENRERGLYFISDQDSRPAGSAHPLAHMWDNGAEPGNELLRLLDVRAEALQRFGANNLRNGQPYAELEEILVPLYFLHRYQVEAVQKILGGTYYHYAVYEGDGAASEPLLLPVAADAQWQALDALLLTLSAETLKIPERVLAMIPPKPLGYERTRESFPLRTALGIDYAAIAETAAAHTVDGILQPERLARLNNLHGLDNTLPSVDAVLSRLLDQVYKQNGATGQAGVVQRSVNNALLYRMMSLLRDNDTDNQVKAQITMSLRMLEQWLTEQLGNTEDSQWLASYQMALDEINAWLTRGREESILTAPLPMPPGAPI